MANDAAVSTLIAPNPETQRADILDRNIGYVLPRPTSVVEEPTGSATITAQGKASEFQPRSLEIVPLVRLKTSASPPRRFRILQRWEGIVTGISEDTVWADLTDMTDASNPQEVVSFSLDDISEADRTILAEGSSFYWSLGYETSEGGQIKRVSEIRLRRNLLWSQRHVDLIESRAADLFKEFGPNSGDAAKQ